MMYALIVNGNFQVALDELNEKKMKLVTAMFNCGILNMLGEKIEVPSGKLILIQGHNPTQLTTDINEMGGVVEFAIIDRPCKFFFVRVADKSAKKELKQTK